MLNKLFKKSKLSNQELNIKISNKIDEMEIMRLIDDKIESMKKILIRFECLGENDPKERFKRLVSFKDDYYLFLSLQERFEQLTGWDKEFK